MASNADIGVRVWTAMKLRARNDSPTALLYNGSCNVALRVWRRLQPHGCLQPRRTRHMHSRVRGAAGAGAPSRAVKKKGVPGNYPDIQSAYPHVIATRYALFC